MGIENNGTGVASPSFSGGAIREVWDEKNAGSLINCLADDVKESALLGREREPALYDQEEQAIFLTMLARFKGPSPTLNRLRTNLWIQFDRARTTDEQILAHHICAGVCSVKQLHMVLHDPLQAAYLFAAPRTYVEMLDETLQYGMMKLRHILDMPELLPNGMLNQKLIDTKVKITAMMDLRKNGAPTQKIEQKNVNMSIGHKHNPQDVAEMSIEQLEQKAHELRKQNLQAQNLPPEVVERLSLEMRGAEAPTEDISDAEVVDE